MLIIFFVAGVLALIEMTPLAANKELQKEAVFRVLFLVCTCISLTLLVYVLSATREPKKYRKIAFFFMLFFIVMTVIVRIAQDNEPLPEITIEELMKK